MKLKGRGLPRAQSRGFIYPERSRRTLSYKPVVYVISVLLIFGVFFSIFSLIPPVKKAKAAGNTYYVSQAGVDTNNGTSSVTPWKHHPWDSNATNIALATVLQGDDTVYLRRGDTWYNTYLNANDAGSSSHQITTTSTNTFYKTNSSDPLPKLSGAYDPSTLVWTNTGGTVYSTPATTQPKIVLYNDSVLILDNNVNPALNKWYWIANVLYVNVGEIPSNGILEAGKRGYVYMNSQGYHTLSYLELRVANDNTGAVAFNSGFPNVIFDHLTIKGLSKNGLWQYNTAGNQITNNTVNGDSNSIYLIYALSSPGVIINGNTVFGATGGYGIKVKDTANPVINGNASYGNGTGIIVDGTSSTPLIHDNTVYNNASNGLVLPAAGSGNIYNNIIHDNCSTGIDCSGIQISNSNLNSVYNNTVYNNGHGFYPTGSGNGILLTGSSASNQVYKNYVYGNYLGIKIDISSGIDNNLISDNLVKDSIVNDIDIEQTGGTGYELIYHNTIIHDPSPNNIAPYTGHALSIQINGARAKFTNNIIVVKQTGTNCNGLVISGNYVDVWTDYNLLYDATPGHNGYLAKLNATNYSLLSTWQTAVQADPNIKGMDGIQGHAESHSIAANPQLVNDLSDFHLQSTSPAIDAGFDTGITTDYAGKQRYDDPDVANTGGGAVPYYDIGAYEYVTPPNPVLQSAACPTQTDYCVSAVPDINVIATSSTTSYNYLIDQALAPPKASVEAGTADADGSFAVPAGAISADGTWYVHVIAKNLDNDFSANYGTYTIKYTSIKAPTISNTSPVMTSFNKSKVQANDKFKETLKQAKEVLNKSLKESKTSWQKKQALIVYSKTIIKAVLQRRADLNLARQDYLNNVRRVVLERQTILRGYNQSIQTGQTTYRNAINLAYQTYRKDLKNASDISKRNQITRTLQNQIHQALLDLRTAQSSARTTFLTGMAKTR